MQYPDPLINSLRRAIGDTNSSNYRISTEDLYYFLQDAVNDVQTDLDMGYTLTISATGITWNTTLTIIPTTLFKMKTVIYVLESLFYDDLYSSGNVQVGDIKVDVTSILKLRRENLKDLKEAYARLIKEIKMYTSHGYAIDTYQIGVINNTFVSEIIYE